MRRQNLGRNLSLRSLLRKPLDDDFCAAVPAWGGRGRESSGGGDSGIIFVGPHVTDLALLDDASGTSVEVPESESDPDE